MSQNQHEFRVARISLCHPDGRIEAILPSRDGVRRTAKSEQSFVLDLSLFEAGQMVPQIGDQIVIKITATNQSLRSGLSARRAKKTPAKSPSQNNPSQKNLSQNAKVTAQGERLAQLIRILPRPEKKSFGGV